MQNVSGPRLFAYYACACAGSKLAAKKITWQDFERLKRITEGKEEADPAFLERCFPDAVAPLREYGPEKMWLRETVSAVWRKHEGSGGKCAVRAGNVRSINGAAIDVGWKYTVLNLYKFPLEPMDRVFVHNRIIAEFESATAG